MEMQGYYYGGGGGGDGDWYHQMAAAFPVLPLCSSSSSSSSPPPPLMMSEHSCLPIASALPYDDGGALVVCSSALGPREEEMSTGYLPMIAAPAAADDLYGYPLDILPPLPADLATAGLDDALLMHPLSFSDIDLEAFGDVVVVEEPKAEPLDTKAVVPMDHYLGALHPRPTEIVSHAARSVRVHDHRTTSNVVAVSGYETAGGYSPKQEQQQLQQARPAARCARRNGDGNGSAAAAGGRSLDHIGFEELRKYFYMPITKAAREMNVGLTVLKKRCRELGVARWPHRKMKSLRSLILNIQEMGISSESVQQELEALERYCARMEENPAIELTEQTKKLRQACFKENYKRRRAAAVNMMDHCYNDFAHDHQQQLRLPLPPKISRQSQSSGFFGY